MLGKGQGTGIKAVNTSVYQ